MNIVLPNSLLKLYLDTEAGPEEIARCLSLCGPTIDHLIKTADDVVYDIEIITNRVDSASALGIAREAAVILPRFDYPSQLKNNPYQTNVKSLGFLPNSKPVEVSLTDPSLVPRFSCIALSNVEIHPSPAIVQKWLTLSGQRPLNNVVDITNELTLKYGQPVHVFDLDLIQNHQMKVRLSRKGEEIITLDGKTHVLPGNDIIIEDGQGRLIDLCGIMGGGLSAVNPQTKNVLLFVQNYRPDYIRKTSLLLQTRTIAAQLFEKKPDPELVLPVLIEGVKLLQERAGATINSCLLDLYPKPYKPHTVSLDIEWLNHFSGVTIPQQIVKHSLTNLGFTVDQIDKTHLDCLVPSYRQFDINSREDLAEEVMRVYGYFRLPSNLPLSRLPLSNPPPVLYWENITRTFLATIGFTEMYNYSLISQSLAQDTQTSLVKTLKVQNPLSQDYEYLRPNLFSSLINNLSHNRGVSPQSMLLFELSNIYIPQPKSPLPDEHSTLACLFWGYTFPQAKGYLEALFRQLKIKTQFDPAISPPPQYIPSQTAQIEIKKSVVGYIGPITHKIASAFSLKPTPLIAEIDFAALAKYATSIYYFSPVSPFSPIIEDLTFTLPSKTPVGKVLQTIQLFPLVEMVNLKTVYEQNYTFTFSYQDQNHQLTDKDIAPVRLNIVKSLEKKYHAVLVGKLP